MTSHPEPVSQPMSLQQPPQPQYNMPDRDKQLLFSEFEDLSASFRSLYKSVFEQTFNQQGELCHQIAIYQNDTSVTAVGVAVTCSILRVFYPDPWKRASFDIQKQFAFKYFICGCKDYSVIAFI